MGAAADRDENEYGEPLKAPPGFAGPTAHRRCTDVLVLLIFLAHLAALTALESGPAPAPLGGPLPPLCGDDERAEE